MDGIYILGIIRRQPVRSRNALEIGTCRIQTCPGEVSSTSQSLIRSRLYQFYYSNLPLWTAFNVRTDQRRIFSPWTHAGSDIAAKVSHDVCSLWFLLTEIAEENTMSRFNFLSFSGQSWHCMIIKKIRIFFSLICLIKSNPIIGQKALL